MSLLLTDRSDVDHYGEDRYRQGAADTIGDIEVPAGVFRRLAAAALVGAEGCAGEDDRMAIGQAIDILHDLGIPLDVEALNPRFAA